MKMNSALYPEKISAIIFDLGGVVLNLDINRTISSFCDLGVTPEDLQYYTGGPGELFNRFEKGEIDPEGFLSELLNHMPEQITRADLVTAWNAMLLDLPVHRVEFLQGLKKQVPVYLLSNTNEIHVEAFENYLQSSFGKNVLYDCFLEVYYSCRMGMRKPDKEIFLHLAEKHGLNPESTLFIDDSKVNVEGAKQAGFIVHLLEPGETIEELLQPNHFS